MVYGYMDYFGSEVLRKRPYIEKSWCENVVAHFERREVRSNGRVRVWARVLEQGGRCLHVLPREDGRPIHNAFPDRVFKP